MDALCLSSPADDDDDDVCVMQLTCKANVVLSQVFEHLKVIDRQYFALRFLNDTSHEPVSSSLHQRFEHSYLTVYFSIAMFGCCRYMLSVVCL